MVNSKFRHGLMQIFMQIQKNQNNYTQITLIPTVITILFFDNKKKFRLLSLFKSRVLLLVLFTVYSLIIDAIEVYMRLYRNIDVHRKLFFAYTSHGRLTKTIYNRVAPPKKKFL